VTRAPSPDEISGDALVTLEEVENVFAENEGDEKNQQSRDTEENHGRG
jgi:hypothetical protein